MEYLKQPLTIKEIKEKMNKDGYIEGILPISLSTIINNNMETFFDILSEELIGNPNLLDISFFIVEKLTGDTLLLSVKGNVSDILRDEDEEE